MLKKREANSSARMRAAKGRALRELRGVQSGKGEKWGPALASQWEERLLQNLTICEERSLAEVDTQEIVE